MKEKYSCVLDPAGYYKTLVLQVMRRQMDGTEAWEVQYYTPGEGERLVDTNFPSARIHAGAAGFVRPRWDDGPGAWAEGATPEEIAAWELEHPDPVTLEDARAVKLDELSSACNAAIVAGCGVTLSDGSEGHFSLQETDQINLTAAVSAVEQGAAGYPYHADGQLCKLFPAADIISVATSATAHKLYHTTYCNHLLTWVRRVESKAELAGVTYGADLPADLAANMEEVLHNAQAQGGL